MTVYPQIENSLEVTVLHQIKKSLEMTMFHQIEENLKWLCSTKLKKVYTFLLYFIKSTAKVQRETGHSEKL